MSFSRAFNFQLSRKLLWNEVNGFCSARVNNSGGNGNATVGRQSPAAKYHSAVLAATSSSQNCLHFHLTKRKSTAQPQPPLFQRGSVEVEVLRNYSSQGSGSEAADPSEGEATLKNTIRKCFPKATSVSVEDISGGCGSMYQIFIESPEFSGLSTVKQHRLVNDALKQEIKSMHGIRIQTAVPK